MGSPAGRDALPRAIGARRGERIRRSTAAVATAVAMAVAPAAIAQTRIQSGEHAGFSRLALIFEERTAWRAERADGGYRLRFTPNPGPIDLSRVFDLIPRDRIENVRQDPEDGSLFIASTCDCHLDVFEAGRRILAIDIKDGADPEERGRRASSLGTPQADGSPRRAALGGPGAPPPPVFITPPASPFAGAETEPTGRSPGAPGTATDGAAAPGPSGPAIAVTARGALERRLRDDLRRAAEAGLVDLADEPLAPSGTDDGRQTGPLEKPARPSRAEPETRIAGPPPITEAPAPDASGPQRNIALRTAFDRSASPSSGADDLRPCPPEGRFAFFVDAAPQQVLASLPTLRAGLVDATDALDPEGGRRLVEAYLSLGFGAEAAALAAQTPMPDRPAAIYRSLARILDRGRDAATGIWSGLQRCPSPAALWSVLGHVPAEGDPPVDAGALQLAYFELPAHLRIQIGAELAARLRDLGLAGAAAAVERNRAALLQPAASHADRRAESRDPSPTDRAGGASLPASGLGERRVDALIDRALARMRQRRLPAADDIALAEALVREHAGTERGAQLRDLVALGRLAAGEHEAVVETLLRPDRADLTEWREGLDRAVAATVAAKSDADLLALALHPRGGDLFALLPAARSAEAAERLTQAGFPDLALDMLERAETAGTAGDRARALATLAAGDPAGALALVAGKASKEAARLRARALSALGSHALAAAAYAKAGDLEQAARAAWLSGDAEAITNFGKDRHRAMAEALLSPAPPPAAAEGTPSRDGAPSDPTGTRAAGEGAPSLSGARELAEESSRLRESLRGLFPSGAEP